MKNKNIFGYIGLMLIMGLTLTACTQDEQDIFSDQSFKTANGFYVYPVNFDCAVSGYDDEGTTRAMSYEWSDKTLSSASPLPSSSSSPSLTRRNGNSMDSRWKSVSLAN